MSYKGEGYCVGPELEVKGKMVFDIRNKTSTFLFLVREDKVMTLDRREHAVHLTQDQVEKLSKWLLQVIEHNKKVKQMHKNL